MGFLHELFSPSKAHIWSSIAEDLGAEFVEGSFWGDTELRYRSGPWELLLDSYSSVNGSYTQTFTRLRTPFLNKDDLLFKLYRADVFSSIGELLDLQDIEIGTPLFDEHFVIKGNDEEKIKVLFANPELQELIEGQPNIEVQIKPDEGFFAQDYPDGVNLLQFDCLGELRDVEEIRNLFEMFSCILNRLVQLDSAYAEDPNFSI